MQICKVILASLLALLFSGCASNPPHGTFYDVLIDSYGSSAAQGRSFVVSPGTEVLAQDQLRFDENARILTKALIHQGLSQASDASHADLAIALFYDLKRESDRDDFPIPSYPHGAPGSLNSGRMIHTGLERTMLPLVGPKYIRYVVVTALDLKSHKMLWETTIMSRGSSDQLSQVVPILIAAGNGYYGKSSSGRVSKTVWSQ